MKTVFITGANKGIGFETARQLLGRGHHVIIGGRNPDKLADALKKLQSESAKVEMVNIDVKNPKSIESAARGLAGNKTGIDVLINNAAILDKKDYSLLNNDFTIFENTLQTNVYGALLVIRNFIPLLRNPARIINISSGGGSMSDPVGGWAPAYCVSKSMLNAITRHLAHELADKNIAVNAVCPGWVQTDMGGKGATRPVGKGAETPVWLALDAPQELNGFFFRDKKQISW